MVLATSSAQEITNERPAMPIKPRTRARSIIVDSSSQRTTGGSGIMYLRARDAQRGRAPEARVAMKGAVVSVICVALLALSGSAPAQTDAGGKDSGPLFPVIQNGKVGYIDKTGKVVIQPQFATVENKMVFKMFAQDGGGGLIEPEFARTDRFVEGMEAVRVTEAEHPWGYIDMSGHMVIRPQFDGAHSFSDGLAVVGMGKKYGYIDKKGQVVIEPKFDYALGFSDGLARVTIGEKYGFIDKTGSMIIKPQFSFAVWFSEGLANVAVGGGKRGKPGTAEGRWGYIDKTGKMVLEARFALAGHFSEGLAAVLVEGSGWGFIDKTGKMVVKPRFQDARWFAEGLAAVAVDGKYGFIDTTGNMVIKPQFDSAWCFSEGLAVIEIGDKWGYADKTGETVIATRYDGTESFSNGLGVIHFGHRLGYIDKTGKHVWEPQE